MEKRNTVQKDLILKAVQGMHRHVTADEVYDFIHSDHPTVSRGTVYRNLNSLAEDNKIRRVELPEGPDRFDYRLEDHYHVRCTSCSRVFDVDMDVIPGLENRIRDTHGMTITCYDILFKGVCPECQAKKAGGPKHS